MIVALTGCVSIEDAVKTPPETNVTYSATDPDGELVELSGVLALPEGEGRFPAVMMIHEWWGLNQDVVIMARALAEEGYVVLAPDAFRGELATSVAGAISLNRNTSEEQIFGDLDAALAYLRDHEAVDPDRVATMGFCFGGRQAMHLGIRNQGLAAVVTLYGSGLVTDREMLGYLPENDPILGIFGEDDRSIPLSEVDAFGDALASEGADVTITVYPDVGHAFVKSSTFGNDGQAGEAWAQIVAFLEQALGE